MHVTSSWHTLATATGPMQVLMLSPQSAEPTRWPAVLFYSEIFQITGPIIRTATMLAGQGMMVLVPEIFHELNPLGTVLAYDDAGKDKGNQDKWTKPLTAYDSDNQAMLSFLQQQAQWNGTLGAMGVCIGGHLAFRAALMPEVSRTLCLYATDLHTDSLPAGNAPQTLAQASKIEGQLVLIFGRQDPHVPLAGRRLIQQALDEANIDYQWHEVNAPHAFMRDEGERYDPALALWVYQLASNLFR